ncbi:unnamed protein product [Acanthosepion pharaonis]|uniref:Uncharacterized protein n=1 Tax=Acanthosepion pharaonis TaxID=158019 RepID=A0A812DML9_ACAPH|nr:unnamed protein product [Sepia pharaonis]
MCIAHFYPLKAPHSEINDSPVNTINKIFSRMIGRVAIVTGANCGLGFEVSKRLCAQGHDVILACRNEERGMAAVEKICSEQGNALASYMHLDLADMSSVHKFVTNFHEMGKPLDLLVNNAGVFHATSGARRLTKDNFEATMGINHLGHFLLTHLLLEDLISSAKENGESRIVNVGSSLHDPALKVGRHVLENSFLYSSIFSFFLSLLLNFLFLSFFTPQFSLSFFLYSSIFSFFLSLLLNFLFLSFFTPQFSLSFFLSLLLNFLFLSFFLYSSIFFLYSSIFFLSFFPSQFSFFLSFLLNFHFLSFLLNFHFLSFLLNFHFLSFLLNFHFLSFLLNFHFLSFLLNFHFLSFLLNFHFLSFLLNFHFLSFFPFISSLQLLLSTMLRSESQPIDLDNFFLEKPGTYNGYQAYKNSKLANVLFTYELAERLRKTGVTVNCVCPGFVPETSLGRDAGAVSRFFLNYVLYYFLRYKNIAKTVGEGADAIMDCATSAENKGVTGKFFKDRKEAKSSTESMDETLRQKVWDMSVLYCHLQDKILPPPALAIPKKTRVRISVTPSPEDEETEVDQPKLYNPGKLKA